MKIVIIGATRGTGEKLLEQALERGHEVTALVRDESRLSARHPNLTVVEGDALDADSVERVVRGQDAVLSTLGAPALARTSVRADGAGVLVEAMERAGVDRLMSLSSMGVRESIEGLPFFLKRVVIPFYLRRAFDDHAAQEERIERSSLDWTVVRPSSLGDGPATGSYEHAETIGGKGYSYTIDRADVAGFMLEELERGDYVRRFVSVTN